VRFRRRRWFLDLKDCRSYKYSISAYEERSKSACYEHCEIKNEHNNCPDFIEKLPFWKFWKRPKTNCLENAMKVIIGRKVG